MKEKIIQAEFQKDSIAVVVAANSIDEQADTTDYDHAIYFVVVADTNSAYYVLHDRMFALSKQLNLQIDTMGRYFDRSKNIIALPEDDEDEMFAGDYFPRRFPSTTLSLEYLDFYQRQAGEKTIALVTGIYETEISADSALAVLRTFEQKGFKIKANVYIGCIH